MLTPGTRRATSAAWARERCPQGHSTRRAAVYAVEIAALRCRCGGERGPRSPRGLAGAVLLTLALAAVWLVVAARTLAGAWRGVLFAAPCLKEGGGIAR